MNSAVRLAVGLSFVIILPLSVSQDPGALPKQDNLYAAALFASLRQMDKDWGYQGAPDDESVRTDYHHMVVKKSEITEKLPDRAGDYQIEVLDPRELVERYRKLRKQFAILVLHPIKNEGAALTVNISVFRFSHKKTQSSYTFLDSGDVEFRYDCGKQEWAVSKAKLGGI